jgi:hypothetical protein
MPAEKLIPLKAQTADYLTEFVSSRLTINTGVVKRKLR